MPTKAVILSTHPKLIEKYAMQIVLPSPLSTVLPYLYLFFTVYTFLLKATHHHCRDWLGINALWLQTRVQLGLFHTHHLPFKGYTPHQCTSQVSISFKIVFHHSHHILLLCVCVCVCASTELHEPLFWQNKYHPSVFSVFISGLALFTRSQERK